MSKLLQKLLYEYGLALSVDKSGSEFIWVLQSIREEKHFYCPFIVEEGLSEHDIIEFYIKPAIDAKERSKQSTEKP